MCLSMTRTCRKAGRRAFTEETSGRSVSGEAASSIVSFMA